jgi:hypothetical protein
MREEGDAMSRPPLADLDDLFDRLDELLRAAEAGGLDRAVIDYLRSCRERAQRMTESGPEDRRIPVRLPEYGRARLVTRDEAHQVELLDHSAKGFGLRCPVPVAEGDYARLDIEHGLSSDIYECVVTHCHPEGSAFRVGLEVFSRLRIGGPEMPGEGDGDI